MPNEPDAPRDDDAWSDVRSRYADVYRPGTGGRWATIKDRLGILGVILVLAILVFLMLDGSIMNFRCSLVEFITFECNRWAGGVAP